MTVNNTSVFVAAQQAVLGFAELPTNAPKVFAFTGNILNVKPLPQFLESGAGKSASAHMMMAAAAEYKDKGFKYAIPIVLQRPEWMRLTSCVDSTMLTNEKQMAQPLLGLMEMHMQSSSASSLRRRRKVPGYKPSSRAWDIRTLAHINYSVVAGATRYTGYYV
ncbi:hypothetical protein THARTR1_04543 [Trichoderma harzianum]|uniref:Uncharacterized protein n=1 Tax=Trichoderma harzianum TaxID=5544 RepID=A0A2K0UAS2_TRIHA|nr:hypothetical protein THARTR1_04543 [Trichoderma harzianum]